MNCIKLNEACLYRMECDASLCKISYCQKSFDDIIKLLNEIVFKLSPTQMKDKAIDAIDKTLSSIPNEHLESPLKDSVKKRRGRPKGK